MKTTDPESRFMPNNKKVIEYSYNPQITADSSYGIIISNDVSSEIKDIDQLEPQIKQVEENIGALHEGENNALIGKNVPKTPVMEK